MFRQEDRSRYLDYQVGEETWWSYQTVGALVSSHIPSPWSYHFSPRRGHSRVLLPPQFLLQEDHRQPPLHGGPEQPAGREALHPQPGRLQGPLREDNRVQVSRQPSV